MRDNTKLDLQHYSTKIFKGYYYYLKNRYPEIDLKALCETAGLPFSYLKNQENWVSAEFAARLTELCAEVTHEKDFPFQAGQASASEEVVGKGLFRFAKYVLPVSHIYRAFPQFAEMFNKVTETKIVESRKGYIRYRYEPIPEKAKDIDPAILEKSMRYGIENQMGYLSHLPTIQNLPPAEVKFDAIHEGNRVIAFEASIQYQIALPYVDTILFLLGPALGLGISSLLLSTVGWPWLAAALSGICYAAVHAASFFFYRLKKLERGNQYTIEALRTSDRRYSELYEAKDQYAKLSNSYSRFVPWDSLQQLGKSSILDIRLGDLVEQDVVVMFADIRDFTRIAERLSPKETMALLNTYLQRVSLIVTKFGGWVDNIIGDGLMAVFPKDLANNALNAAEEMFGALELMNLERRRAKLEPIHIGVGLNAGRVVLGTVGSTETMRLTVISDCANTASRLEGMTKRLGVPIAFSKNVYDLLSNELADRAICIGHQRLRGKEEAVLVYVYQPLQTFEGKDLFLQIKSVFQQAISLLDAQKFAEVELLLPYLLTNAPLHPLTRHIEQRMSEVTSAQGHSPQLRRKAS
jgi:class 3 adenylate cyclase